jgi:ATP phosphoribosyltransferase regulatory subunit
MDKENRILLPTGFKDLLPPESVTEREVTSSLLESFAQNGYARVRPPMVEYEASLLSGKAERLKSNTLRLMDQVSKQMLAIRSDITGQVARIAASRLKDSPRPLRLSYYGEVFRVAGEGLHAERQLTQAGIELIGSNAFTADAEVALIAATALKNAGIEKISIDFCLPELTQLLLEKEKLSKAEKEQALEAIERKDLAALRQGKLACIDMLEALIKSAGDAQSALTTLKSLDLPTAAKPMVERLASVIAKLEEDAPQFILTIDPLERRGFEYHTELTFSLFSANSSEELGRGGRYKSDYDIEEDACGFSLLIDNMLRILPSARLNDRVYVPFGTAQKEITALQEQGTYCVRGLEKENDAEKEATSLGCAAIYKNGKVSPL